MMLASAVVACAWCCSPIRMGPRRKFLRGHREKLQNLMRRFFSGEFYMRQKQLLAVMLFAGLYAAAQTTALYDNFDKKFLNPSKWYPIAACYTDNGTELECVR